MSRSAYDCRKAKKQGITEGAKDGGYYKSCELEGKKVQGLFRNSGREHLDETEEATRKGSTTKEFSGKVLVKGCGSEEHRRRYREKVGRGCKG